MTARPLRVPRPGSRPGLRVLPGRMLHRPMITPWLIFSLVAVAAFMGLVLARTTLDRSAFELAELQRQIASEATRNQQLRLEIARLESPARIAPLAQEMGMVYPEDRQLLSVAGVVDQQPAANPRWTDHAQFTALATP